MGRGELHIAFWWVNLRERDHFEDPGVDGKIVFICILRKSEGVGMDWIDLAQDGERWRAL
jgi:hypothetical protein